MRCLSSCSRPDDDAVLEVHVWRNWFCTLKMWAWVLRFLNNCRGHAADGELRLDEIERANVIVLRQVQKTAFGKGIASAEKSIKGVSTKQITQTWCICWFWWLDSCWGTHPTFDFVFWVETSSCPTWWPQDRILHCWSLPSTSSSSRSGAHMCWNP